MKLKTLDRYVLREIRGPFFFGVLAFTLIMVAGGLLFKLADLIIEQGVPLGVAFRLFVYQLPSVVVLTLPMSCLLGCLLGFGSLAANSEITALKASGLSFGRIVRPVVWTALIVALLVFLMGETLVPLGARAVQNVMTRELVAARPALLQQGVFLRTPVGGGDDMLYIERLDSSKGEMSGVVLQHLEKAKLTQVTTAERGLWRDGRWDLYNGRVFDLTPEGKVNLRMTFQTQSLTLGLTPRQLAKTTEDPDDMSVVRLGEYISLLEKQGQAVQALKVTWHLKFALPLSCLFLALVGATVGAGGHRRGGASVGFGQSVLIVFVYYLVMTLARSLGGAGKMPPLLAAWLPNLLFALAAFWLVRRAD